MSLVVPGGFSGGWRFLPKASNITVPSAPTALTATGQSGQISLIWNTPVTNGGSPILQFAVTYNGTTVNTNSASTSYVLTGLANGVAYTITVAAINAVGSGAASNAVIATPQSSGTPVPMVSGQPFSSYVLAKNGDWEFAEMASMTGSAFLASQSVWVAAPYYQFMESNNFNLSLMKIVKGQGLVLNANNPQGVGIWTNPNASGLGLPNGNFSVVPPFYREVQCIFQSSGGHNVNWSASWMLGTNLVGPEFDQNEIDNGVVYTNIHAQNNTNPQSQQASFGVLNGTYRFGLYVTNSQTVSYWDAGGGTPGLSPAGAGANPGPMPGGSLSGAVLMLLHTNTSPGFSGDTVYDSSTIPYTVVYDRTYVPS